MKPLLSKGFPGSSVGLPRKTGKSEPRGDDQRRTCPQRASDRGGTRSGTGSKRPPQESQSMAHNTLGSRYGHANQGRPFPACRDGRRRRVDKRRNVRGPDAQHPRSARDLSGLTSPRNQESASIRVLAWSPLGWGREPTPTQNDGDTHAIRAIKTPGPPSGGASGGVGGMTMGSGLHESPFQAAAIRVAYSEVGDPLMPTAQQASADRHCSVSSCGSSPGSAGSATIVQEVPFQWSK